MRLDRQRKLQVLSLVALTISIPLPTLTAPPPLPNPDTIQDQPDSSNSELNLNLDLDAGANPLPAQGDSSTPFDISNANSNGKGVAGPGGHEYGSHAVVGDLICRPFGECERCPDDELYRPYCHPYGNRRLVHCIPHLHTSSSNPSHPNTHPSHPNSSHPHPHPHSHLSEVLGENAPHPVGNLDSHLDAVENGRAGEIPAWESCGKVVGEERGRYGEFVTTNTLFLIISLFVLMLRANKLAAVQYRQLAARIGIGVGGGGV